MKLTGIEMQGFKSFADRIKLTFEDGITGVVGPNGSGKSNISDAVKWVFGEQSSKSLRGTKMEDVIFNGTAGRKAQGFAWVALTIDNHDRSIDVDSDEVVIARKLYRSGESEYRVNNNLVRLRDIHEIFMDTGLGRDGYSIIEQGKIAEIVSAKSTQRREIFEEAAGISKYRYRKEEAQNRLKKAEENLLRLRDIMTELEARVTPLRVQSEKAKQFLVYSEEKKTLEISLWLRTLDRLRGQLREQEDKILVAKADRGRAQNKLDEIERQLDELYHAAQDCTVCIENKRARIRELEEKAANAQVVIAVKENDIQHNNAALASLEEELCVRSSSTADFDAQIAEKRKEIEDREKLCIQLKHSREQLTGSAEQQKKALELLTASEAVLSAQRSELRENIAKADASGQTAQTLVEETVGRMDVLRGQLKDRDQRLIQIREELKTNQDFARELAEKIEGLDNTCSGYQFKLDGRKRKLSESESQQQALEHSAGELMQKAQLLADLEKNMEGFSGSVKYLMRQNNSGTIRGLIGPVSSLIKVDGKFATAIEISMGSAMQNIVVENESVAKHAIAMLKNAKEGRSTFLPLTTIRGRSLNEKGLGECPGYLGIASDLVDCSDRYREIVNSILGKTVVAEDIDTAVEIARKYSHRFRVVTLDGQIVNAGGSMTGGYVGKSGHILNRKNDIEQLQKKAKALLAEASSYEEQGEKYRREVSEIQALLDGVNAEAKTAGEDLITVNAEIRRLKLALEEAEQNAEQSLEEFDRLTKRLEQLRSQSLSSQELTEQLKQTLEQLEREIEETAVRHNELDRENIRLQQKLAHQEIELAGQEKDLDSARAAETLLLEQKEGSTQRLEELQEQAENLKKQNAATADEIEQTRSEALSAQNDTAQLNEQIRQKMRERDLGEQKSTELRREEKVLTAQRENLSGELARLEERYLAMNTECDTITAKLWDEYEMTKTQAQEAAIPLDDVNAANKRLNELKNKIRALGSVNVAAIEEYTEVSERYRFLKEQIEDVEQSKEELDKLIRGLSDEMSRIFLDKFEAINHHFGQIFTEMFGGGKGELRLTDPNDPLETGIDIFVQPSGKMVGLSLLSGGEKAIVAICIYFAILKVNPAPFVLLDEIEAALDEVNVARFAAYLRKMCEKTQFIAITHRRGTMEGADILYGVTMEEEGVSKLLRLNVEELESKLHMKDIN